MKAVVYIQSLLDDRLESQNPRNSKKYRHFLDSVKEYMGDRADQLTLNEMASHAWRSGYLNYLKTATFTNCGEETQGYSPRTIDERLSTLTIICRKAIRHYLLPNISLTQGDNNLEINKLELPDSKGEMLMLMAKYSSTADAIRLKYQQSAPRQEITALRKRHHLIGLSILSVLCGGIGLSGVAMLRRKDYDGERLQIPYYNQSVVLPDSLQLIIEDLKSCAGSADDGLVYADWAKTRTLKAEPNLTNLSKEIQKALKESNIAFTMPYGENFTQFLNIALQNGSQPSQLQPLVEARYDGEGRESSLQSVIDIAAKDYGHLSRNWYGASCKIDNQQFLDQLKRDGSPVKDKDFFVPYLPEAKEIRGKTQIVNQRQLSRMFFFKGIYSQARALQRLMGIKGYIYTKTYAEAESEANKYQTIPEREIENLRRFLDAKSKKLISPTEAMNYYGCHVRVKAGIFKGCEGVIEDRELLRARESGPRTFTSLAITILGQAVVAHPHIDTSLLELI